MALQYVIAYESGPFALVGPFDTEVAADEWAASYAVEYRAADGKLDLAWNVEPVSDPCDLEWWT